MPEQPKPQRVIYTPSNKTLSQRIVSFNIYGTIMLILTAIGLGLLLRPNGSYLNYGIFFLVMGFAVASSYLLWLISKYVALQEENNRNLKQIIEKLNKKKDRVAPGNKA